MLKVLFLNRCKYFDYNSSIHIGFISYLQKHFEILECGSRSGFFSNYIETNGSDLLKISKSFNPDVILTYNSNGSTEGKRNYERLLWAETFLKNTKIKKFHITTDHCQLGYDKSQIDWFSNCNIDVAIFRHKSYLKHPVKSKSYWLPFSIDKTLFETNSIKPSEKMKIIGFAGTVNKSLYPERYKLISFLKSKNRINISNKKIIGGNYVDFLSNNFANITCGGTPRYFTAKYIEILAAGSLLICSDTDGLDVIPKDFYLRYDNLNLDNFLNKYENFSSNVYNYSILHQAKQYMLKHHSHESRYIKLKEIIESNA